MLSEGPGLAGAVLVGVGLGAAVLTRPSGVVARARVLRTTPRPGSGEGDRPATRPTRGPRRRPRDPAAGTPSAAAGAERVAALLRAGATVDVAWERAGPAGSLAPELRAVRLVVERSGAAPGPALEACAVALAEAEDARAAVRVATAGARTSARIVGWLPLAGLLLGWLLGAPPWEALLGTPWGRFSAVLGLLLLLLGRAWAARIVGAALHRAAA